MAVPKRKTSRTIRNQRRSHHSLTASGVSTCPQCKEPKLPHRICGNCGTYKGREVIKDNTEIEG